MEMKEELIAAKEISVGVYFYRFNVNDILSENKKMLFAS